MSNSIETNPTHKNENFAALKAWAGFSRKHPLPTIMLAAGLFPDFTAVINTPNQNSEPLLSHDVRQVMTGVFLSLFVFTVAGLGGHHLKKRVNRSSKADQDIHS